MDRISQARMWHDRPQWGVWLMLASVCIHTTGALFEMLLLDVYAVPQVIFMRAFFRLIPLAFTLIRYKDIKAIFVTQHPWLHCLRLLAYITYTYCILYVMTKTTMSNLSAMQYLTPLFTIGLSAWFLKEQMNKQKWIAMGITAIGMCVAFRPSGQVDILLVVAFIAILGGSFNKILIRKLTATEHSLAITVFGNLAMALCSFPFTLVDWHPISWHDLVCFGIASLLAVSAQFLSVQALRFAQASSIAMLDGTSIVWATIYDFWIWKILPNVHALLGSAMMVGSNLYLLKSTAALRRKSASGAAMPPKID